MISARCSHVRQAATIVPRDLLLCVFSRSQLIPNDETLVLPVLLLSVYSGDESALLRTN